MDKLQEIREALAAATPGPWMGYEDGVQIKGGHGPDSWICQMFENQECECGEESHNFPNGENNAHLIANAPEYLAHLLETVEQLQNESRKLDKRIDDLRRENDQLHMQKGTLRQALEKAQYHLAREQYMSAENVVDTALSTIEGGKAHE